MLTFKTRLKSLGIKHALLQRLCGVTQATVSSWCQGNTPVPEYVNSILFMFERMPEEWQDLARQEGNLFYDPEMHYKYGKIEQVRISRTGWHRWYTGCDPEKVSEWMNKNNPLKGEAEGKIEVCQCKDGMTQIKVPPATKGASRISVKLAESLG